MRKLLAAVLLYILCASYVQASLAPASLVGLWRFGQYKVWVQINPDGSAYQCRIAPSGTVYAATGTFTSPGSLHGHQIWGVDQVSLHAGTLVVKDLGGSYEYQATTQPMGAACSAPEQRSNISSKRTREKPRAA
jgi:hypothetical protein